MIPLWVPILAAMLIAFGELEAGRRRALRRHARILPRPRPHRVLMSGRHARPPYRARHGAAA